MDENDTRNEMNEGQGQGNSGRINDNKGNEGTPANNGNNDGGSRTDNSQDENLSEAIELKEENKLLGAFVYMVIGICGVAVLALFWMVVWQSDNLLNNLSNASYARGLITFVFALGTTAIAVILVVAVLLRRDVIIEKRFRQGREVLGILIGVLGTIVGFYFGTTVEEVKVPPKIETVHVSEAENNIRTIGALIKGGESPYKYSVIFDNENITKIEDNTSEDGWILEQVTIPADVKEDIKFTVLVQDKENQETEKSSEIKIKE